METVSRVYDTYAHANQAVQDIEATGVPSSEVSRTPEEPSLGVTSTYSVCAVTLVM